MIEVEKRFYLNEQQEAELIADAEFVWEKEFHNVYLDYEDFRLFKKHHRLRNRNGGFELKVCASKSTIETGATFYDEIEDLDKIASFLKFENSADFETKLEQAGIKTIADYTVTRRRYKKDDFHIDIDSCDFDYHLVEIEIMLDDESKKSEALEKIDAFAAKSGIDTAPARGKLSEYLKRFSPDIYKSL